MRGVSVVVCCYNSASRLPQTIAHLARQVVPTGISWEIVVVDNASTDSTPSVAKSEWQKHQISTIPFSVIAQPRPGLSHAREMGISHSKYEYIIFCDDDNLLCETYVHQAYNTLELHPDVGAVGGFGKSFFRVPGWLGDFAEYYALGHQGNTGDVTHSRGCLYGAGLVIRRSTFHSLKEKQFESLTTDRTGGSLSSGGDTELTFAMRIAGYKLYYNDKLEFEHVISKNRFSLRYFVKLIFNIGYSWAALTPYHIYLNNFKQAYPSPNRADIFYSLRGFLLALLMVFKQSFRFNLTMIRRSFVSAVFKFGEFWFFLTRYQYYKNVPKFLSSRP